MVCGACGSYVPGDVHTHALTYTRIKYHVHTHMKQVHTHARTHARTHTHTHTGLLEVDNVMHAHPVEDEECDPFNAARGRRFT